MNRVKIVFDAEIKNAIPPKNPEERIPDIIYNQGWRDFANMGIACLAWVDMDARTYNVVCKDNLSEFKEVVAVEKEAGRKIGSFNGVNFDNQLLAANGIEIAKEDSYDLLREIWTAAGLDPDKFVPAWHGGYGLDAMAKANGLPGKTGNGALAPVDWQRGEIGKVINYCLRDVWITEMLFRRTFNRGMLTCPKSGSNLVMGKLQIGHVSPQVTNSMERAELSGSGIDIPIR